MLFIRLESSLVTSLSNKHWTPQPQGTRGHFILHTMINVSCGPRFQLLTSVISLSPWQHKVNNKNSPNPGRAQRGMSVLKENKCVACAHIPARGPVWNWAVNGWENVREWKTGTAASRPKKKSDYLTKHCLLSVGGLKGTQLLIFMGLYRMYFTFCTNVFWIIGLLCYIGFKGSRRL